MVHLSRIYTRTGDDGGTHLGDGSSLPKSHPRVASYGSVDELSSVLGMALVEGLAEPHASWLRLVQNDLFDVGSDLCVPGEAGDRLRITERYTKRIEDWIDTVNAGLEPLNSFVLPGGNRAAAWLHLARTTCRRAERHIVELYLSEQAPHGSERTGPAGQARVNHEVLKYVNRLSDLLFVLARAANDGGRADVLWQPGANR
jgi:cob(I)alamin adenosyltransferase